MTAAAGCGRHLASRSAPPHLSLEHPTNQRRLPQKSLPWKGEGSENRTVSGKRERWRVVARDLIGRTALATSGT